jgi:hypothetical protein
MKNDKTQENGGDAEVVKKQPRKSSDYIRVVGDVRISVVNTKQNPNDVPKKARDKKWAVIATSPTKSGGWKKATISMNDKKYDAISALLNHEIALKAAENDKKSE